MLAPGQEHLGGGASTPICQAPPWVTSGNISRPSRASTGGNGSATITRFASFYVTGTNGGGSRLAINGQ